MGFCLPAWKESPEWILLLRQSINYLVVPFEGRRPCVYILWCIENGCEKNLNWIGDKLRPSVYFPILFFFSLFLFQIKRKRKSWRCGVNAARTSHRGSICFLGTCTKDLTGCRTTRNIETAARIKKNERPQGKKNPANSRSCRAVCVDFVAATNRWSCPSSYISLSLGRRPLNTSEKRNKKKKNKTRKSGESNPVTGDGRSRSFMIIYRRWGTGQHCQWIGKRAAQQPT